MEVSKTSNTVSDPASDTKEFISYKHKANVTKMSHARSRDLVPPGPAECLEQLDRLVKSPLLQGSEALCKLLQYLADHTLNSPADHLKEYQIGTEVLGRPADFDPQSDSSVRMQVGRLRTKLTEYYNSAGVHDPILVDIPKGRYTLSFEWRYLAPDQEAVREPVVQSATSASAQRRWMLAGLIVLAIACAALWIQNRAAQQSMDAMQRSFYPWRFEPAVSAFWSGILDARPDTDVVMADSSFSLVQLISKKSFSFQDYLSRSYVNQLQTQNDLSPEMRDALNLIAVKNLESASDFRLARRILGLDPLAQHIHLYYAREYMASLLKQDNVILIGSPIANPWDELFESRLTFTATLNNGAPTFITDRAPAAGEQSTYIPTGSMGYCTVAYLPNPDHNGSVLLLEGTGSEATEAAGDFLLSEDQLSNFQKMLHVSKLPYFEVLLKASQVKGTPLSTTLVAYRIYPNLH
ncbi:MAG TPA: hypothetical protein VJX73_01120 [Terracidiphilus sp.]|nr:hypothetical protein [Terracidiphilus sp.]